MERKHQKEIAQKNKAEDAAKKEKDEREKQALRKQFQEEIRQKMKEHERERQQIAEKWKRDEIELKKKTYSHKELERKYNNKVVIPSLERKKEELRKRREHFMPISRTELIDHQKQYEERLRIKLKEHKLKREKWYKDIGYGEYDPSKYTSKFLLEAEEIENMPRVDPKEAVVQKVDKEKNYANFVREMHKPKISLKKKDEMKRIIEEIEKSGMSRGLEKNNYKDLSQSQREPLRERNKSLDTGLGIKRDKNGNLSAGERPYGGSSSANRLPKRKFRPNPMVPKPKLKRKGNNEVEDYLMQRRVRRQERESESLSYDHSSLTNWEKIGSSVNRKGHSHGRFDNEMKSSSDLIEKQRLEMIKMRAKQIEEEAMAKEKVADMSVKATSKINSMLLDSIEAKLHLLKDI